MTDRRTFLKTSAIGLTLGLAGCMDNQSPDPDTDTETQTDRNGVDTNKGGLTPVDDDINIQKPKPLGASQYEEWEPQTNCNDGEQESMYNSEISVSMTNSFIGDEFKPIVYDDLPDAEKEIIAVVLQRGGYATCEVSDAFQSFMERAINQYAREQDGEDHIVWLKYENQYYRLNIRQQDQVYAY